MNLFDAWNPRDPRPFRGEGLQHYIERVVMGLGRRATQAPWTAEWYDDFRRRQQRFFEPSYVFAPCTTMGMLTQAIRGQEMTHQ